jgi:hypothetical protein
MPSYCILIHCPLEGGGEGSREQIVGRGGPLNWVASQGRPAPCLSPAPPVRCFHHATMRCRACSTIEGWSSPACQCPQDNSPTSTASPSIHLPAPAIPPPILLLFTPPLPPYPIPTRNEILKGTLTVGILNNSNKNRLCATRGWRIEWFWALQRGRMSLRVR